MTLKVQEMVSHADHSRSSK